ncbi:hypothetical protein AC249_AIPGENE18678 [Exaiptasia diaphana]|nr:hypothetical protein AC249_AIPGENE18678 [Exaiptasia diaphana]
MSLESTEKIVILSAYDKKERKQPNPRFRNHRDDKEHIYESLPSSGQALVTKTGSVSNKIFVFCHKTGHSNTKCYEVQKMNIDKRWKIVSAAKVCVNCLLPVVGPKTLSYLLENSKIADSLNIEKIHPATVLNTIGLGVLVVPQQTKKVKFFLSKRHRQPNDELIEVEAWTTKTICELVEPVDIDFKQFDKLKGLQLADDCPRGAATLDVLGKERFKVSDNLYTEDTLFGWTVRGVVPDVHINRTATQDQAHTQTLLVDTCDINEQLKAFRELETIGIHDQVIHHPTVDE